MQLHSSQEPPQNNRDPFLTIVMMTVVLGTSRVVMVMVMVVTSSGDAQEAVMEGAR